MLNKCCLLLLVITVQQTVLAQTFSVSGKVADAETGNAISDASVFLSNTTYGTVSNSKGEFVLSNIPQGKYDLVVSYIAMKLSQNPFPTKMNLRHLIFT